jgi:hypothetical protein
MTGGGGLAGIDVADNDDVDVELLFTHVGECSGLWLCGRRKEDDFVVQVSKLV